MEDRPDAASDHLQITDRGDHRGEDLPQVRASRFLWKRRVLCSLTRMFVLVIPVCMFIRVGNDVTKCSDNCSNNFYAIPVPSN